MTTRRLAPYVVALTLAAFVAAAAKEKPPAHPVRVSIKPRLGLAPLRVTVRVSLPDPTPEWTCPEVRIEWPDGTASTVQQDCDPADPEFSPVERVKAFPVGEWVVVVKVTQGAARHVVRQRIEVVG